MTITAKVFMSGRSQALHLPARLRLTAKEVRPSGQDLGFWLQGFYANSVPLPNHFLADRQDPQPQERYWI